MRVVLIIAGAVLMLLAFGLAFTVFGLISAFLGIVCLACAAVMFSSRPRGPRTG